jgi:signal transduction histidine kinase
MKLLTKTNQFYFIFLLLIAPVIITVDYFLIRHFVNSEVNEILKHEGERIKYHLNREGVFPDYTYLLDTTLIQAPSSSSYNLKDTLIFDAYANEFIPYREYEFTTLVGNDTLGISIRHVLLEMNKLILWAFVSTVLVFIIMVSGVFFINQKISKWAWKPFYNNLSKLEQYDITRKGPVQLEDSGILEFETLNKVISTLMQQVEKDFKNLKEFNENISHEIQTPLSIIRNKMVLLLESPNLEERERQSVEAAYQEVNKLSKIGKSLTLISRIENQEFRRLDDVDLRILVENISSNMAEIIHFKDLQVSAHLKPVTVKCDPILANILFTNLLKNAIQHNQEGGYIRMLLDEKKFEIENTGEVLTTETTKLFNRFQKGNTTTDSLGLGLAINQKICEIYGFQLDYEHQEGKHRFSLYFANDQ